MAGTDDEPLTSLCGMWGDLSSPVGYEMIVKVGRLYRVRFWCEALEYVVKSLIRLKYLEREPLANDLVQESKT